MTLFYNTEKLKEEIGIISTCCWCYTGFKTRHGVVGVIQVSRLDMVLLVLYRFQDSTWCCWCYTGFNLKSFRELYLQVYIHTCR